MAFFIQDIKTALRSLLRAPRFTLMAVFTLGLGMAATITLFGALHTLLLRKPPFPKPDQLYTVELRDGTRNGQLLSGVPVTTTEEVLRDLPEVEAYGRAVRYGKIAWEGPEGRVLHGIQKVDAGLQNVLGWRPFLGSWFDASHLKTGQGWILSYRFWKSHLGGDPSWIGRNLTLDRQSWPVVGISRPGFELPVADGHDVDVLMPLPWDPDDDRTCASVLLRLRAGVPPEAMAQRLTAAYQVKRVTPDPRVRLRRLQEVLSGRMDHAFLPVFVMGALMLTMAAATVAGLFLARAAQRSWETSMRLALGAPAVRLFGHFFAEGVLVAMSASLLAFAAAAALSGTLRAWLPGGSQVFGLEQAWAHPSVAAFAVGIGLLLSLVLTLVPMLHLRRLDPGRSLAEAKRQKGHGALVVAQVALATLLMAGTSLLGRSLIGLLREDLGFRTRGIVKVHFDEVDYSAAPNPSASSAAAVAAMHRALEALRSMPGIKGVGLSDLDLELDGEPWSELPWNQLGEVATVTAGDGFAEAMGLHLVEGRTFSSEDLLTGRRVCMIDSRAARTFFAGHALGHKVPSQGMRRFQLDQRGFGWDRLPPEPLEVIGVMAPIHPRGHLAADAPSVLWIPSSLGMLNGLFVRSDLPVRQVRDQVASVLKEYLPTLKVSEAVVLEDTRWERLQTQRQVLGLVGAFGSASLILACLGLGGLMWGTVVRRTREIGLRAALGATPGALLGWILRQGVQWMGLGLVLGMIASLAFSRVIASLLYGIQPTNPSALGFAILLMTGSALIACLIPALRAARVDPSAALRGE